jgi:hypothetical protein
VCVALLPAAAAAAVLVQGWQPCAPGLVASGGKDGYLLLFDTSVYAEPDGPGCPKFCGPVALAEAVTGVPLTALAWTPRPPARRLYSGDDAGEGAGHVSMRCCIARMGWSAIQQHRRSDPLGDITCTATRRGVPQAWLLVWAYKAGDMGVRSSSVEHTLGSVHLAMRFDHVSCAGIAHWLRQPPEH